MGNHEVVIQHQCYRMFNLFCKQKESRYMYSVNMMLVKEIGPVLRVPTPARLPNIGTGVSPLLFVGSSIQHQVDCFHQSPQIPSDSSSHRSYAAWCTGLQQWSGGRLLVRATCADRRKDSAAFTAISACTNACIQSLPCNQSPMVFSGAISMCNPPNVTTILSSP